MKKIIVATVALALSAGAGFAEDKAALVEEGKGLIMQFATALKGELMAAVAEKGAPHAISVCNLRAPEIASVMSDDSGWVIGRSSHKLRNPANEADAFTAATIEEFLARQEAGEKAADMAKAAIVEEDGKQVFRLVKAIPTGGLCLNCHGGDQVKPPVVAALAELYPDDQARDFTEGEMRGVFTLFKPLD